MPGSNPDGASSEPTSPKAPEQLEGHRPVTGPEGLLGRLSWSPGRFPLSRFWSVLQGARPIEPMGTVTTRQCRLQGNGHNLTLPRICRMTLNLGTSGTYRDGVIGGKAWPQMSSPTGRGLDLAIADK